MRLIFVLILAGLMQAARSFAPDTSLGGGAAGTALACGYLLLSAFLMGSLFKSVRLPRLTGYLTTGIVVGPQVLQLVSTPMVTNLQIFNGIAIALIALTAGVELDLRSMKPLFTSISWLTGLAVCGTIVLISLAVFVLRARLPFLHGMPLLHVAVLSCVFGVTMVAQSPAVVVALHSEMASDGPLTRTVLGVVVLSDLLVIVLFAIVSSIAKSLLGSETDALHTAGALAWEVLGSLVIGSLVGFVVAVYLQFVKGRSGLFVLAAAFLVAEVGQRIDLDPLLIALATGVLIRNATPHGKRLQDEIEASSLPVYVVFFAVTGATIHIRELLVVGVPAILLILTRACGFIGLGRIATTLANAPETVRSYIGFGLMPQAGLALALALLFVKTFPTIGAEASALVFGGVAINEMVAPVLYRFALVKTGEAGVAERMKASVEVFSDLPKQPAVS
ncbi:MAG: cation:proton antiporter [Acidobacteriaceae bacterium]|nr:cation:proton antiporter [Acidobacteriaceae bacterium]